MLIRRKGLHRVSDKVDSSYLQISLAVNILPSTFAFRAQVYFRYHYIIRNCVCSTNNDAFSDTTTMENCKSKTKSKRKKRGTSRFSAEEYVAVSGISKFSASNGLFPRFSTRSSEKKEKEIKIYIHFEINTSHCANGKNKCYCYVILFVDLYLPYLHIHTHVQYLRLYVYIIFLPWRINKKSAMYDDLLEILQNKCDLV